jgi:hypothetical protein
LKRSSNDEAQLNAQTRLTFSSTAKADRDGMTAFRRLSTDIREEESNRKSVGGKRAGTLFGTLPAPCSTKLSRLLLAGVVVTLFLFGEMILDC